MTEISYAAPATRYEAPDDKQLAALLKIVEAANAGWTSKVELDEFRLAMAAVGAMWRLDAPSTQYSFSHFLDEANIMLRRHGQINGPAFLRAIVAHNDVPYRLQDRRVGEVLALGLDLYSGRPCSNAWRGVLKGDPLRPPLPPREFLRRAAEPSPIRYFQEDRRGRMQQVGADADLWRR